MKQTEILEILESTSVGAEVAEHETELPRIFISDIEVYRRLVNDEVDLITGGKERQERIYRMITETGDPRRSRGDTCVESHRIAGIQSAFYGQG